MVKTTASMSADAFFRLDSAKITAEASTSLDEVISRLKANGHTGNIHLTGHTCNLGSVAYNQALSERRAVSIKEYLISKGVAADSFIVEGKGKLEPRYPNNTKANRHKNRRVDMEFVSYVETEVEVPLPAESDATVAKPDAKPVAPPTSKPSTYIVSKRKPASLPTARAPMSTGPRWRRMMHFRWRAIQAIMCWMY
jgi:hypothetical protein